MIEQLQDLVRYHSQAQHVPVELLTDKWQLETWDKMHIVVALPVDASNHRMIEDMAVACEPDFAKGLGGDLVVVNDMPVARVGTQHLALLISPRNTVALAFVRKLIDQHLPRLCRQHRHGMRDALVESIASCVHDRKRELQSSIREDTYELERTGLQMLQLSRKLEMDRQVLKMFERSPDFIKARAVRTFVDLLKLVPGSYAGFSFKEDSVVGTTYPIEIEHDGYIYHFHAYEVECDLRQGKVFIRGGSEVNGYIHPHVTDGDNICWGNIGHLVSRLAGELDLFGLFQLVHEFLKTYNESDPFQKIEKWDPNYEEPDEDEEPYCSWCDDYGHDISECEDCWWCDHCQQYDDHDEENCPNRPREEEVTHAVAEQASA